MTLRDNARELHSGRRRHFDISRRPWREEVLIEMDRQEAQRVG
jgi:hypothetical protein